MTDWCAFATHPEGDLHAEAMHGFRAWLLTHEPSLAVAGEREPDAGGLNIEGLAWDPRASALLFGQRGPANPGRIAVIQVPVDAGGASWTTASLKAPSILRARIPQSSATQGIRDISYDEQTGDFLILLGRSISRGNEPFQLCTWNGSSDDVRLLDVTLPSVHEAGGRHDILKRRPEEDPRRRRRRWLCGARLPRGMEVSPRDWSRTVAEFTIQ